MDSKELKGLMEAYVKVYAPQEIAERFARGGGSIRPAGETQSPTSSPTSSRTGKGRSKAAGMAARMRFMNADKEQAKQTAEELEIDEAVKGADPEMRKAASAERRAGDKTLSKKVGDANAAHMARKIRFSDKISKAKRHIPGYTYAEEVEQIDEITYSAKAARAGKDIGKPGKMFAKIAKEAGKRYGSEERGKKVAGAVLAKLRREETEVDIFDTVLEYLVAEGAADNNQEALKIMANLSEEEILEYRKLAAAAVGGLMALNMMKPGIPSPQHRTPTPERERTELPSSQRSPGSTESLKKRLEDAKKKNDADAAKLDQTIQKDKAQRDASYRR